MNDSEMTLNDEVLNEWIRELSQDLLSEVIKIKSQVSNFIS